MGLLSLLGKPLSWEEIKAAGYDEHIRRHGLVQFVSLYNKLKDRPCDVLKWGDEVEYMLVSLDHENKSAKLLLRAEEILPALQEQEENNPKGDLKTLWRPEYAAYMVEGTPGKPYGGLMAHLNTVEANMKLRRQEVDNLLDTANGETALSLTAFPRLGCPNFSTPWYKPNPSDEGVSKSLFIPDEVIYPGHPRFRSLTKNIRKRRGEKVVINIPIFKDKNTPSPFVEEFLNDHDGESARAAAPDHVYMDCMCFGMGNSCLQMTFQACNITEARHLYDQLSPLCPIILALSAASPIYKGYVTDQDCRWNVIAGSVDDRTAEERNLEPLKNNKFVIPKSRYGSIDSYLSPNGERYSDVELVLDERDCQELMDKGIDRQLARHIAHLFIRDPVSVFAEMIDLDDTKETDHFENIQSTNWQSMRFKPPPVNSNIGWRVEFRPMEVQLTDFENAAFVVFVVLLTRTILTFRLNLLMLLSKVDLNMQQAQKRNAVLDSKFYFRKDLQSCARDCPPEDELCLLSVDTIINGGPVGGGHGDFPGLIPLINQYVATVETDLDTRCTIECYLRLISDRASGKLQTLASWIRNFVTAHAEYQHDSVVTERINYDLVAACDRITKGHMKAPELFHCTESKSSNDIPNSVRVAQEIV